MKDVLTDITLEPTKEGAIRILWIDSPQAVAIRKNARGDWIINSLTNRSFRWLQVWDQTAGYLGGTLEEWCEMAYRHKTKLNGWQCHLAYRVIEGSGPSEPKTTHTPNLKLMDKQ
jgi:hypothetical protein